MSSVHLEFSRLENATFEPSSIQSASVFGSRGLSTLLFSYPMAVLSLRKYSVDQGLKREARSLTSAIKKNQLLAADRPTRIFDEYLLGGLLTDFGVNPWRALGMLFALVPMFAVLYSASLLAESPTKIWVLHYTDGPVEKNQRAIRLFLRRTRSPKTPLIRALSTARRVSDALRIGLFFSVLSAFRIGWKDFNVGDWISRIQTRSYTLKASGWLRSLSGFQSLLSLYFVALWAITYFGNPFE